MFSPVDPVDKSLAQEVTEQCGSIKGIVLPKLPRLPTSAQTAFSKFTKVPNPNYVYRVL